MHSIVPSSRIALAAALLIAATGCGSSAAARFYLLAPAGEPPLEPELVREEGPLLYVGPVRLPGYLARDQIVTRAGSSRLVLGEYDRWAEPVEQGFVRVLVQDLSRELPAMQVVPELSEAGSPGSRLALDVQRFDLGEDRLARLAVRWVFQDREREITVARRAVYVRPAGAEGYDASVAALSATLADLSRDVARELIELGGG
jgi:uncharacterized protein